MNRFDGKRSLLRHTLLHAATLAFCCGVAHAELNDAAAADQPASDSSNKVVVDLGNITVTAQSRTQEAQAVPIAVQIVTQKQIDALAATDLSRMNGYVPSLFVDGSSRRSRSSRCAASAIVTSASVPTRRLASTRTASTPAKPAARC